MNGTGGGGTKRPRAGYTIFAQYVRRRRVRVIYPKQVERDLADGDGDGGGPVGRLLAVALADADVLLLQQGERQQRVSCLEAAAVTWVGTIS